MLFRPQAVSICFAHNRGSPATLRTRLAVVIRPGAVWMASVLTSSLSTAVTDTVCTACSSTCDNWILMRIALPFAVTSRARRPIRPFQQDLY